MRFHYPLSGLLLALLLTGYQTTAQTTPADTTRISYEEEVQPLAPSAEDAAPLRLQREAQSQWKLGLNNFSLGQVRGSSFYTRYGVHIAYERKLSPAWAVQGELSPAIIRYRQAEGELRRAPGARVQLMGRYYHDLESRIRKGKNRGSFSGNYFALAVGGGLGRHTRDTPFYYYENSTGRANNGLVDVALLYGVQRRLGRYGFIDANIGASKLLAPIESKIGLNASLRVGLLLGAPAPPEQAATQLGAADDAQLRPRYYVGVQGGSYNYTVRFSNFDPYAARPGGYPSFFQRPGVGAYNVENKNPYLYVGYQLRPRLAVQLGYQGQAQTLVSDGGITTPQGGTKNETYEQTLAFPLLARYSLTHQYQRRLQFDVVGGVAIVYARVRNEEKRYSNGRVTESFSFGRRTTGASLMGGLNAGFGIGRKRKFQLTAEYVRIQSLQQGFKGLKDTEPAASLGLRYRFGRTF